jgi:hypothetical protein
VPARQAPSLTFIAHLSESAARIAILGLSLMLINVVSLILAQCVCMVLIWHVSAKLSLKNQRF